MPDTVHMTQDRERCDVGAPSEWQTAIRTVYPDDGGTTCSVLVLEDGSGVMSVRLSATECAAILPDVETRRAAGRDPLASQLDGASLGDALACLARDWTASRGGG